MGAFYIDKLDWGFLDNINDVYLLIRHTKTWFVVMNFQYRLCFSPLIQSQARMDKFLSYFFLCLYFFFFFFKSKGRS